MKMNLSLSGITSVLYHFAQIDATVKMLESGFMVATPIAGTQADQNASVGSKKKLFFLSTTTSRDGAYHRKTPSDGVLLTLDGRKLAQRYSGSAVDYWQYHMSPSIRAKTDEMEQRVYSNDAKIPVKYITRADLLIDPKRKITVARLRKLKTYCAKHKIELRIFDDPKQWLYGRKTAKLSIQEMTEATGKPWSPRDRRPGVGMIGGALEMLLRSEVPGFEPKAYPDKLTEAGKYAYKRIVVYSQDASNIDGEAQNAMRKVGTKDRAQLDKLLHAMKKRKFRTFKDLTDHLQKVYS